MRIKSLLILTLFLPMFAFADCSESSLTESRTVWLDANFGARKKGGANGINKTHKKMEAEGWCFKDLELYTENGDLEGFFLSYTRSKNKAMPTQETTDK